MEVFSLSKKKKEKHGGALSFLICSCNSNWFLKIGVRNWDEMTYQKIWPFLRRRETQQASSSIDLHFISLWSAVATTAWKVKTTLRVLPVDLPETAPPCGPKSGIPVVPRSPIWGREGHGPGHVRPTQHRCRGRHLHVGGHLTLQKQQPRRQFQGSSTVINLLGRLWLGVAVPRLPRCFLPHERNGNHCLRWPEGTLLRLRHARPWD